MPFAVTDQVRSSVDSARVGVITRIGPLHGDIQYYEVFWGGVAGTQMVPETDLQPHVSAGKPSEALANGLIVGYQEFQRVITFHRLSRERPLRNNIYAFNASRTQFFPFQFKPLIKLLDSTNGRLLVCDEVGLGKTIEAGLILLEERGRREVRTVLIICPSGLRAKWQLELRRRFDEKFAILDNKSLREFLDEYELHPDRAELAGIVSLETIRSTDLLTRIKDVAPAFDLVIVDEAHHLRNQGTLSRQAGVVVGADADTLVLLTATPVHLGTENLYSLLNILDNREFPDEYTATERFRQNEPIVAAQGLIAGGPAFAQQALAKLESVDTSPWLKDHPLLPRVRADITALESERDTARARRLLVSIQRDLTELNLLGHMFTRTRKREVKIQVPVRDPRAWSVPLTPLERALYESVSQLVVEERQRRHGSSRIVQWALNTVQRRMASSIHATVEYYRRYQPFDAQDKGEDEDIDESPDVVGTESELNGLRQRVRTLVQNWPADVTDSKYDRLTDLLREQKAQRPSSKVMVFAFFKETLRYLSRRLGADGVAHVRIDGDVTPDERERLIAHFHDDPLCRLMLSSRVGSEGLDFQFCDTLVNYDLPWNPMEVEQRIGRLDRIGQHAAKILIFNLWTADTIEERILKRLYERIGIFERAIGALDPIIGDIVRDIEAAVHRPDLTAQQQEREADRIAGVIERERLHLEQLEKKAATFVGVDAFFEEEIEGIKRGRRYVTGAQLLRFLEDYLRSRAPATRLRYDPDARRGVLTPDPQLRRLVQRHHRAGELVHFMGASDGVQFTVDAEVAFDDPMIEFVSVLHPLIEIIRTDYEEELRSRVSAQHVAVRSNRLSPGRYVFMVYRLRVDGARSLNFLEAVILDEHLQEVCDRETAEAVMGEMVELGADPPEGPSFLDASFARRAIERAEMAFLERVQQVRRQEEQDNAALIERRTASIRFQFHRRLGDQAELLARQEREGKPERILQMTRGKIKKLEGELARQLGDLETHRKLQVGYDEVAAGVLEVTS